MSQVRNGDRIRILQTGWSGARVRKGDELEVIGRVTEKVFVTESPRVPLASGWWFGDHHEGEGWERVELS